MKRFLFIVSALFVCLVCCAQKDQKADYYHLSLSDKPYPDYFLDTLFDDCGLTLLKDGRYVIVIDWDLSDDMIYGDHISMGNYTTKGDTIYFNDKFTSYKFEAVSKDEKITFTKGFPFMIGNTFTFRYTTMYKYDDSYYDRHKSLLSETKDSIAYGEPFYPLEYKSYEGHKYSDMKYILNINEDETYSFVYGGLLFSAGKWERIGNIIRLKDSYLNHDHYVLVKENELVMYTIDIACKKISLK